MTAAERIKTAIRTAGLKVQDGSPYSRSQCPGHEGKSLTLSIFEVKNKATLKCFAGCESDDILAVLGMTFKDRFNDPRGSTWEYPGRTVSKSAAGKVLQEVRDKKKVHLLWPEKIAAAVAAGTVIYVPEGESDCDAVEAVGCTATTSPQGAGSVHLADWSPLAGAHEVIILTDKDEPGYKRAAWLLKHLRGIVAGPVSVREALEGKDVADHLAAEHTMAELVEWVPPADVEPPASADQGDDDGGRKSASTVLVEIALAEYSLHCTGDAQSFAVPLEGVRHVARRLKGGRQSLRAELSKRFYAQTNKTAPQQALADALLTVEGIAQDGEPETLHLRVAEADDGGLWIDTGDNQGTVIKIDGGTFTIVTEAPVLFDRTALTLPMPIPVAGGDIAELWEFVNVAEADQSLLVAAMVASFFENMPHPIPTFTGEQGTGKSTTTRMITELLDPSSVPLRTAPRDAESWVTAAAGSWVVAVDNLSQVQDWFSDSLCRAVTGDGNVKRALYTDGGLAVVSFRRQVMLTGIDFAGLKGDLSERLLLINLNRISDANRMDEREMNRRWAEAKPRILGALLEILAKTHALLPSLTLDSKPRMADFARVLMGVDLVRGTDGLARYMAQSRDVASDSLTASSFMTALLDQVTDFEGTAAELLDEVQAPGPENRPPRDWPKSPRAVTSLLRVNGPALRKNGWIVDDLGNHNAGGVIRWALVHPEISRIGALSNPPTPPSTPTNGGTGEAGHDYGTSHNELPTLIAAPAASGRCPIHDLPMPQGFCGPCRAAKS